MNFLPLCSGMVWPIISGTVVERRDQVFTTFFSLRVFRPSPFSRRWPSTNGPFFSERAIFLRYSSTLRKRPHCARRIFLKPRTGPGTRCDFGQNGHTNRVPCALGMRSTITDQPGWTCSYGTGSGGATTTFTGRAGLPALTAVRFEDARFTGRLVRRLAARPVRVVLVARMVFALTGPPFAGGRVYCSSSFLPTLNDLTVCPLVPAGLLAQRRESPGRLRVITLDAPFSSAVRMIHRVHGHAAHGGLDAAPPRASGLAESLILMVKVANLADRGHAIDGKLAHFAAGHLHQREVAFLAQQLRRAARGTLFRLEQGLFRLLLGDMVFVQDGDKPPRRRIWIKAFKCHRCLLPSYFFPAPPCRPERSAGSQR